MCFVYMEKEYGLPGGGSAWQTHKGAAEKEGGWMSSECSFQKDQVFERGQGGLWPEAGVGVHGCLVGVNHNG